jgi:hypothetical protein
MMNSPSVQHGLLPEVGFADAAAPVSVATGG